MILRPIHRLLACGSASALLVAGYGVRSCSHTRLRSTRRAPAVTTQPVVDLTTSKLTPAATRRIGAVEENIRTTDAEFDNLIRQGKPERERIDEVLRSLSSSAPGSTRRSQELPSTMPGAAEPTRRSR